MFAKHCCAQTNKLVAGTS